MEGVPSLTQRQREILALLAKGLSNREIGSALGVSASTVKTHVEHVLRVLGATNRTEAAALAAELDARGEAGAEQRLGDRPAVAVLRFDVDAQDAVARTFASGLADDLIALLCKWRWFPVIARSTSQHYGSDQPAAKLGQLIGASYLIGGTVLHRSGTLRVSVRLDDARSELCLWSDRFELPVEDIFKLQDEIAAAVVGRAYAELFQAEGRRCRERPPEKLSAWQLAHAGVLRLDTNQRDDTRAAIELFDRAAEQDPSFVLPLYGKGMALFDQVTNQWCDRITDNCAEMMRCAERAIRIDENDAAGWVLAGRAALMVADTKGAIAPLERAVALNQSHARAHSFLGQAYVFEGDLRGFENLRIAARLSPRAYTVPLAFAQFSTGEYAQAAALLREELARRPEYIVAHALLCASFALSADVAAARAALSRMLELHPGFRLANVLSMAPPGRHEMFDRIAEGLRLAGLAE